MGNIKNLTPKQIAVAAIIAVLTIAAIVPNLVYPAKRGDAYVQVDTATYNTLVRDNDSLRFTLDSIMLLHSKVSSDITKEVAAQLRRRALIDSVYKVIDRRLDTLYSDRVSSANLVPYEEFASAIVTIPYEDVQSRCNFVDITDDLSFSRHSRHSLIQRIWNISTRPTSSFVRSQASSMQVFLTRKSSSLTRSILQASHISHTLQRTTNYNFI